MLRNVYLDREEPVLGLHIAGLVRNVRSRGVSRDVERQGQPMTGCLLRCLVNVRVELAPSHPELKGKIGGMFYSFPVYNGSPSQV